MASTNEIRNTFLGYFERNGHTQVASGPLVPRNDPSLMFANSGMVQFKNVFTGQEQLGFPRATTSQKCVRAGGKHNDLDNVGYTARHHTFFEMLGNFSFGDYFKETAIEHAWTLVTKEFGLDASKLLVTVHTSDEDAAVLWRKIAGISDDRIIRIPTSDNFWSMGDTGPCGPCSEIFYDHGEGIPGGPPGSPDEDGDRFIEIWNLVFMQFEQVDKDTRIDLPRPSIDTGMGLERIAAVLQGQHDNYGIDLMRGLIENAANAAGTDPDGPQATSHRVIADHLRCSGFLIADGVLPSNEGRGYVLRRIMRRGMRHAHLLGCREPLMHRLVPSLVHAMGEHFTELKRAEALMTETLLSEETRFRATLERGLRLLDDEIEGLPAQGQLSGEVAFKLYDTYGFPRDLTADILRGRELTLDQDGFDRAMDRQRAEARKAWAGSGEAATDRVWFDLNAEHGPTEFLGYDTLKGEARVVAIITDGMPVDALAADQTGWLVVNQTPFYGESGGQVGDRGTISTAEGVEGVITDTQKRVGALFTHAVTLKAGALQVGDAVVLTVDGARRAAIRGNHSATHLLHAALRDQVGSHITQKGSLVDPERLRFDISHPKPLTDSELMAVEAIVNAETRANTSVVTRLMAIDEAMESGAMALFGEKYGDEVRVVTMGTNIAKEDGGARSFSVELCGGTHVGRTGDIGAFKVVGEGAVAAGVRRVEAVTGAAALAYLGEQDARVRQVAGLLKVRPDEVAERVGGLVEDRRRLEREIAELRRKLALGGGQAQPTRDVGGVQVISQILSGVPAKELKSIADGLKQQVGSGVVVVVGGAESKASIVVGVSADLTTRFSAVDLVRIGADRLGGKGGGGRPDMAQAGGTKPDSAPDAVEAICEAMQATA